MSKKREAFNFYRSYYDVYMELNDKDKVLFMDALLNKQFKGIEPTELKGMVNFAYLSQKHSIDKQVKGWEDKTKTVLFTEESDPTEHPIEHPTEGGTEHPCQQEEEKGKEEGKEEVKITVDVNAFLNWFNLMKEKYVGIKGKFSTLNKTTLNNLKNLKQQKLTPQDWEHAFEMMCANEWVIEKQMQTPTHFLVNDNFFRYLNQQKQPTQPKQQKSIDDIYAENVMKQMELNRNSNQ